MALCVLQKGAYCCLVSFEKLLSFGIDLVHVSRVNLALKHLPNRDR